MSGSECRLTVIYIVLLVFVFTESHRKHEGRHTERNSTSRKIYLKTLTWSGNRCRSALHKPCLAGTQFEKRFFKAHRLVVWVV